MFIIFQFFNKEIFSLTDVRHIVDNQVLYDKYEEFSVRRALAADPDTRWCPAPDCRYVIIRLHRDTAPGFVKSIEKRLCKPP